MGSLSMKTYRPSSKENKYCLVKRLFYLLYILQLPMNVRGTSWLFVVACFLSLVERYSSDNTGKRNVSIPALILEEEMLNIITLMLLTPAGVLRLPMQIILLLWSVLHIAEWFKELLMRNPNYPGISKLRPMVAYLTTNKIQLVLRKN